MGFSDIIYSEIRRAKDKKTKEKEKIEIAYNAVNQVLNAYLLRVELVDVTPSHRKTIRKLEDAENLYEDLEIILIELGNLLNPDFMKKLKKFASAILTFLDDPETKAQGNLILVRSGTDSLITDTKILISELEKIYLKD